MSLPIVLLPSIIDAARSVLDRVLPDPDKRAAAELELRKLEAEGTFADRAELAARLAQIEVNKTEAGTDAYRGGWRPFVGWVCGASMAWTYVLAPTATFAIVASGHALPELPKFDNAELMTLAGVLLGVGGYRTFEKVRGAS